MDSSMNGATLDSSVRIQVGLYLKTWEHGVNIGLRKIHGCLLNLLYFFVDLQPD